MGREYFHRVEKTATRVCVNNPTLEDLKKSLEAGAISGTTNPAYGSKRLKSEPKYILDVIDRVVAQVPDDDEAADRVYQKIGTLDAILAGPEVWVVMHGNRVRIQAPNPRRWKPQERSELYARLAPSPRGTYPGPA
jgi:hypothetical protein